MMIKMTMQQDDLEPATEVNIIQLGGLAQHENKWGRTSSLSQERIHLLLRSGESVLRAINVCVERAKHSVAVRKRARLSHQRGFFFFG